MPAIFQPAKRAHAKLRLALIGPSGSGKTFSALSIASALLPNGRIAVVDTEQNSVKLYADLFKFSHAPLETHSPLAYVEAIHAAEAEGFDVVILDSLSHAWIGIDGALEQKDRAAERNGNSYTAWRAVSPKHTRMIDAIVSSSIHVIATVRAKTAYVQEKDDKGKTIVRKLGLEAVQRDGLEYEFTLVGDLDQDNTLRITKTRLHGVIAPGEVFERPGKTFASKISDWLGQGADMGHAEDRHGSRKGEIVERTISPPSEPIPIDKYAAAYEAASDQLASQLDSAFDEFLTEMRNAPDLGTLVGIAGTHPARPQRGTKEHDLATVEFKKRRAALEEQRA